MTTGKDPDGLTSGRILWTQFGLHPPGCRGAGWRLVGHTFLGDIEGLGFVLTALFVVLTMDAFRARPDTTCTLAWLPSPPRSRCWSPPALDAPGRHERVHREPRRPPPTDTADGKRFTRA